LRIHPLCAVGIYTEAGDRKVGGNKTGVGSEFSLLPSSSPHYTNSLPVVGN